MPDSKRGVVHESTDSLIEESDMAVHNPTNQKLFKLLHRLLPEEGIGSSRILLLVNYRLPYRTLSLDATLGINLVLLF